jgi:hypothetical protein
MEPIVFNSVAEMDEFIYTQATLTLVNDGELYRQTECARQYKDLDSYCDTVHSKVFAERTKLRRAYDFSALQDMVARIKLQLLKYYGFDLNNPRSKGLEERVSLDDVRAYRAGLVRQAPDRTAAKEYISCRQLSEISQTWPVANHGERWTDEHDRLLAELIVVNDDPNANIANLIRMATKLQRRTSATISRAADLGLLHYKNEAAAWFAAPDYIQRAQAIFNPAFQPQAQPKEILMSTIAHTVSVDTGVPYKKVEIEFVNGKDVNTMSEDDLVAAIRSTEATLESLRAIQTESTKLKAKRAELEAALVKMAALLDAK